MGLGRSEGLSARFGLDRSAESAPESLWPALWGARVERRLRACARSGEAHGQPGSTERARPEHTADQSEDAATVAVLGRRGDLDEQEQRPQSDARREEPVVADVGR